MIVSLLKRPTTNGIHKERYAATILVHFDRYHFICMHFIQLFCVCGYGSGINVANAFHHILAALTMLTSIRNCLKCNKQYLPWSCVCLCITSMQRWEFEVIKNFYCHFFNSHRYTKICTKWASLVEASSAISRASIWTH